MKIRRALQNVFKGACLVTAIAGGLGLIYGHSIGDTDPMYNQTYRGFRPDGAGTMLIFDPEPETIRKNEPEFRAWGNLRKLELEEDQMYHLTVGIPRWNWLFDKRITHAIPVQPNE